ncbi:MAG TPA: ATP-binding protein [Thermoanaerobaculia bacterium]
MVERLDEQPAEMEELRSRLHEAEETLRAIRHDEVDALVILGKHGEKVYTLKSADRPYRLMIEGMRQGAVTLSARGYVLYCNAAFAGLVRTPLERIIGSAARPYFSPADLFDALLAEGAGEQQAELIAADGTSTPVYLSLASLPLLEDEEPVLCLLVTDLTDQKRERELRQAWVAAEAMNKAKDRFLATLSHELRTPLTPVLAVVSSLEKTGKLPAKLQQDLAMIRRNIELEARLIDDLLDLTRVTRGKLELQRKETDLRQVLDHAIQTCCGERLAAEDLAVTVDLAAGDHLLWADPSRLTQVFWNLFNNAVKFTPPGGSISVRSWHEEGPSRLAVEISDTGVGIQAELLPRIFDAFEQGETGAARQSGLGLGLAISRAIVELHGGEITVSSAGRDQGAAFTVRLPVRQAPREAQPSQPAELTRAAAEAGRPLHILLVEDHVDTALAMADLLKMCGHEVAVAFNVAQALDVALSRDGASNPLNGRIDLVISDLGLPDGNGYDLMRELSRRHPVPGIALSGYGMEEDIRKSREAGFHKHLTKPVNLQVLEEAIQQATREAAFHS